MIGKNRYQIEKLMAGDALTGKRRFSTCRHMPDQLRKDLQVLGPTPKTCLETFVDLGLSDREIARYFNVPHSSIKGLCQIWGIRR